MRPHCTQVFKRNAISLRSLEVFASPWWNDWLSRHQIMILPEFTLSIPELLLLSCILVVILRFHQKRGQLLAGFGAFMFWRIQTSSCFAAGKIYGLVEVVLVLSLLEWVALVKARVLLVVPNGSLGNSQVYVIITHSLVR